MPWNDVKKVLPDKDGDYLVVIKGAEMPTVLSFDDDVGVFFDEDMVDYNVEFWLDLPKMPESAAKVEDDDSGIIKSKLEYAIYFSLDEVITYRENLSFMLTWSDVSPYVCGKLTITHVLTDEEYVKEGFCVLSFQIVAPVRSTVSVTVWGNIYQLYLDAMRELCKLKEGV